MPHPDLLIRAACPVCQTPESRALIDLPMSEGWVGDYLAKYYRGRVDLGRLAGFTYRLAFCDSCRLGWQTAAPTGALAEILYTQWLDIEATRLREAAMSATDQRTLELEAASLPRLLGKAPGEIRVLDYGMGWCRWARWAVKCGVQTYGTDLSEAKQEHSRALGVRVLSDSEWESETFDYIHCDQVLEHLPDPRETVARLIHLLTPGGYMMLGTPNAGPTLVHLMKRDFPPPEMTSIHPLEHVNSFTNRSLIRLGEHCGLQPVFGPPTGAGNVRSRLRPYYRRFFSTHLLLKKSDG